MGRCTHALHAYRGPLVVIAIGIGFMLVGAVPVAVTYATNAHGSATIIGVGFVGFGLLVVLPGLAWCLVRRVSALRCCRSMQDRLRRPEDDSTADFESAVQRHLPTLPGRQSSTTKCFIMTDEQYLCSDKSAIYFEPDGADTVTPTGSPEDHELEVDVTDVAGGGGGGSGPRGDGYIQLTC